MMASMDFTAAGGFTTRHQHILRALPQGLENALEQTRVDRVAFAALAGLTLDPWQAEVASSSAQRILLNCSRQAGKSTVTSVLAAHEAIFKPSSLTLMVSQTERQSGELFRKAKGIYRSLGKPIRAESESALQLELTNGSRIVALPGKEGSIRSYSNVSLLLLDEASRVPDETYMSVRPMLAVSGGRLVALSTPFGTRGWWYDAWRGAEGTRDDWRRWEVPATQCPRITAAFLDEERRTIGAWWFEQEYLCQFKDAKSAAFRSEDIEQAFSEDYDTWQLG